MHRWLGIDHRARPPSACPQIVLVRGTSPLDAGIDTADAARSGRPIRRLRRPDFRFDKRHTLFLLRDHFRAVPYHRDLA